MHHFRIVVDILGGSGILILAEEKKKWISKSKSGSEKVLFLPKTFLSPFFAKKPIQLNLSRETEYLETAVAVAAA